jgi:hypothetical protein
MEEFEKNDDVEEEVPAVGDKKDGVVDAGPELDGWI